MRRKLTEEHKGKIVVKSEEGKGSIFTIKLPIEVNEVKKGGY